MDKVYDDIGGHTRGAVILDKKVKDTMKTIVKEELSEGTPIEVLEHVIFNAIRTEILKQSLELRINKKKQGEIN